MHDSNWPCDCVAGHPPGKLDDMTQALAQILHEVERLSVAEQVELRRLLCERIPASADLTDEDFASLAAAAFRDLDEEEQGGA